MGYDRWQSSMSGTGNRRSLGPSTGATRVAGACDCGRSLDQPLERHTPSRPRRICIGRLRRVHGRLGCRLARPGSYDRRRDIGFPNSGSLPKAARSDGSKRYRVDIGPDPVGSAPPSLSSFLRYPGVPLSARATAGFLSRTRVSKLRFAEGFISALEEHLAAVAGSSATRSTDPRDLSHSQPLIAAASR